MFPWLIPLLGAGVGALAGKKNPVGGALLGAGLGAVGGQFLPGLLSPAGTLAGESIVPGAADAAAMYGVEAGAGAEGAGLLGGMKKAADTVAPFATAASVAGQAGLLGGEQQMPAPQVAPPVGTGNQTLAQLASGGQAQQELMAAEQARRQRRRGLLGVG